MGQKMTEFLMNGVNLAFCHPRVGGDPGSNNKKILRCAQDDSELMTSKGRN